MVLVTVVASVGATLTTDQRVHWSPEHRISCPSWDGVSEDSDMRSWQGAGDSNNDDGEKMIGGFGWSLYVLHLQLTQITVSVSSSCCSRS